VATIGNVVLWREQGGSWVLHDTSTGERRTVPPF
jgi:hypothetical protein